MYAQLYHESEEGNVYPLTERIHIDDRLVGCLSIPQEYEGWDAFWKYYNQSYEQHVMQGGWDIMDNNIPC